MESNAAVRAENPSAWVWVLRAGVLAAAAALLWGFVTAGQLVTYNTAALPLHGGGAFALHVATGVQALAAVVVWLTGDRGTGRTVALVSLAAFVLSFPQAALGSYGPLQAHVPLAAIMVALVVWAAVLVFRRR